MQSLTSILFRVTSTLVILAQSVPAQSTRDSAGIRIVENARPAWKSSEQLWLSETPQLAFGNATDSAYRFRQVHGVMRLSDGRIAVADGGSLQLRLFSADGRFLSASAGKGDAPGQLRNMNIVSRLHGDTIAIASGFSTLALYASNGQFARSIALPSTSTADPMGRLFLIAVLNDGSRVGTPLPNPAPRAKGMRWSDSTALTLYAESNAIVRELGPHAYMELEQSDTRPTPPWLSAIGVFEGGNDHFYAGYGDHYAIRVYTREGKLESIIRRAWTPIPVTPNDWEQWVIEWSKLWIKSTGAERERDVQKMREEPWAEELPAFSQFIVDRSGRLWVREAHWQDAIGAGSLTDIPAVPSKWSVFDVRGRWLGDVKMPADFQPFEIGTDYVAGKARSNGVNQVVIYGLSVRKN